MSRSRGELALDARDRATRALHVATEVLATALRDVKSRRGPWRAVTTAMDGVAGPLHRMNHQHDRLGEELQRLARVVRQTPRDDRPRCGARTRSGRRCNAPVVWDPSQDAPRNGRCRCHGGMSTGPRDRQGARERARSAPRVGGRFAPSSRTSADVSTAAVSDARAPTADTPSPTATRRHVRAVSYSED